MLQQLGGYVYDVFVARFDLWLLLGITAQLMFAARFLVQWIASEVMGRSIVPTAFWFFSIAGGLMTLAYGLIKREPVIIIGQVFGILVYLRNIMLIIRMGRAEAA